MEVSTFEILYKPLTPPLGPGTEAIGRRVLQGYFLTVANMEAFDFRRLAPALAKEGGPG